MKVCGRCRVAKPKTEFWRRAAAKDGLNYWCKDCKRRREAETRDAASARRRKYGKRRPPLRLSKEQWREKNLWEKYRMRQADYEALLKRQRGRCAICQRDARDISLCIDHDHQTGRIRGLLCVGCNSGLGRLGDTYDGVLRALGYLAPHRSKLAVG